VVIKSELKVNKEREVLVFLKDLRYFNELAFFFYSVEGIATAALVMAVLALVLGIPTIVILLLKNRADE
jgi:uncharacterized membrane protein SpoIIM required for sporulation